MRNLTKIKFCIFILCGVANTSANALVLEKSIELPVNRIEALIPNQDDTKVGVIFRENSAATTSRVQLVELETEQFTDLGAFNDKAFEFKFIDSKRPVLREKDKLKLESTDGRHRFQYSKTDAGFGGFVQPIFSLNLLDSTGRAVLSVFHESPDGAIRLPSQMGFSGDGKFAFSLENNSIKVYDVVRGRLIFNQNRNVANGLAPIFTAASLSFAGTYLTLRMKAQTKVWHLPTKTMVADVSEGAYRTLTISQDEKHVIGVRRAFDHDTVTVLSLGGRSSEPEFAQTFRSIEFSHAVGDLIAFQSSRDSSEVLDLNSMCFLQHRVNRREKVFTRAFLSPSGKKIYDVQPGLEGGAVLLIYGL